MGIKNASVYRSNTRPNCCNHCLHWTTYSSSKSHHISWEGCLCCSWTSCIIIHQGTQDWQKSALLTCGLKLWRTLRYSVRRKHWECLLCLNSASALKLELRPRTSSPKSWPHHVIPKLLDPFPPFFHCLFLFRLLASLVGTRFPPFLILPPSAQSTLLPHKSYSLCSPTEASPPRHLPDTAILHDLSHVMISSTPYRSFVFQGSDSQIPVLLHLVSTQFSLSLCQTLTTLVRWTTRLSTLADHPMPHPLNQQAYPDHRSVGLWHLFVLCLAF